MYSAMIGLSISFMVLGVILAITAVFVFFKKNMAQVYDALLDRGYQERLQAPQTYSRSCSGNSQWACGAAQAGATSYSTYR